MGDGSRGQRTQDRGNSELRMERLGLFFDGRSDAATFGLLETKDEVGGKNGATRRSDIEGSEPDWH